MLAFICSPRLFTVLRRIKPLSFLRICATQTGSFTTCSRLMDAPGSSREVNDIHVAHWNVRTLGGHKHEEYNESKVEDLVKYLAENDIDILGIAETHVDAQDATLNSYLFGSPPAQYRLLLSNQPPVPAPSWMDKTETLIHNMKNSRPGVGLLVKESLYRRARCVESRHASRMTGIVISTADDRKVLIIEAYSPTDKEKKHAGVDMEALKKYKVETKDEFYRDLRTLVAENRGGAEATVVMGDFNGRTGWRREWADIIGDNPDGEKVVNFPTDNGLRLLNFCRDEGLVIVNNQHSDHATWHGGGGVSHCIDFILAGRNAAVSRFHTHASMDIGSVSSDHRLIRADLRLTAALRTSRRPRTFDLRAGAAERYRTERIHADDDEAEMPVSDYEE